MNPLVSIPMVTYAHEAYLAQAIESVLAQDLDDWELVVGDDASPDRTQEVLAPYRARHPERIRVLPHAEHIGPRQNFIRTLEACRGRYVAQLDGDDAWCWTGKLRAQVDFLEAHPDHAMVFCASRKVYADGREEDWYPPERKARYELEDLISLCFSGSGAMMFRRAHLDLTPWFRDAPVGDWPLHALNARHGSIGYIDRVGMMYRQHAAGRWGGLDALRQLQVQMATRDHIHQHLGRDLDEPYLAARLRDRKREIQLQLERGDPQRAGEAMLQLIRSPEWSAHPEPLEQLEMARTLEQQGCHAQAGRLLALLLREQPSPQVPRLKVLRRWMRCSLRSLLSPAYP